MLVLAGVLCSQLGFNHNKNKQNEKKTNRKECKCAVRRDSAVVIPGTSRLPLCPSTYKAFFLLSFIKSSSLPFFPSAFFSVFYVYFCSAVSKTTPQIAEDEQIGLVVRKKLLKNRGGGNFFWWLSQKECPIPVPRGYHYIIVVWISTYCSQWGIHILSLWLLYHLALVTQVTFDYFGYFLSRHNVYKSPVQHLQSKAEIEKQCIIPNCCSCHTGKGTFLNLWEMLLREKGTHSSECS